ncbi:sugar isomerase [Solwaraspora sp. WMMD406]|uniref:SIS domain-containing protein n=1 Tax=Solwaraspora sp. WMMD406 TaxID=3016095 RepID=UPI002416AE29|nr:sugar isomerase [Solwaraspora sp. WMMD406]MDG4768298.1 sugar isomerase [Solwaraspora sp. WMMD406]
MAYVDAEIASQPECWRLAARQADDVAHALPRPGERVAVAGCGTSWFMAMAYAGLRERAGQGETDAFQASEFPVGRDYDRIVVISRSGTTTEVLALLGLLAAADDSQGRGRGQGPGDQRPTTVIVADPQAPASALARHTVALPFADERSVVQTRFATSVLALLRAHLGEDLTAIAADAEVAVRAPLPINPTLVDQATFLGRGWTVGLAHEAALKCREAAIFWSEAYPAMDYRHGPIAIAAAHRVVWAFGEIPEQLADEVTATGAAFVHSRTNGVYAVLDRWAAGRQPLDPMADLILAQRFAVALAQSRGLDPDHPRHLTRSVVLA